MSDTRPTLIISDVGMFFNPDQVKWVETILEFFFWAIFNRQKRDTAFLTDSKSISNTVASYLKLYFIKVNKIYLK